MLIATVLYHYSTALVRSKICVQCSFIQSLDCLITRCTTKVVYMDNTKKSIIESKEVAESVCQIDAKFTQRIVRKTGEKMEKKQEFDPKKKAEKKKYTKEKINAAKTGQPNEVHQEEISVLDTTVLMPSFDTLQKMTQQKLKAICSWGDQKVTTDELIRKIIKERLAANLDEADQRTLSELYPWCDYDYLKDTIKSVLLEKTKKRCAIEVINELVTKVAGIGSTSTVDIENHVTNCLEAEDIRLRSDEQSEQAKTNLEDLASSPAQRGYEGKLLLPNQLTQADLTGKPDEVLLKIIRNETINGNSAITKIAKAAWYKRRVPDSAWEGVDTTDFCKKLGLANFHKNKEIEKKRRVEAAILNEEEFECLVEKLVRILSENKKNS